MAFRCCVAWSGAMIVFLLKNLYEKCLILCSMRFRIRVKKVVPKCNTPAYRPVCSTVTRTTRLFKLSTARARRARFARAARARPASIKIVSKKALKTGRCRILDFQEFSGKFDDSKIAQKRLLRRNPVENGIMAEKRP